MASVRAQHSIHATGGDGLSRGAPLGGKTLISGDLARAADFHQPERERSILRQAKDRLTMRLGIFALTIGMLSVPAVVLGQEKIDTGAPPAALHVETMAILPWHYAQGTDGAVKTAKEFLATLMEKSQVDTTSEVLTTAGWKAANGSGWDDRKEELPTPDEMLRTGKKLGVDWVMAGRARWHTKSVWIGTGPKTKSDCTVDALIVDVQSGRVALNARGVRMDDTAQVIYSTPPIVSDQPKTPHEQRAVQLAEAKALQPWLATHMKSVKIDAKDK
jgi:hypothetical protein